MWWITKYSNKVSVGSEKLNLSEMFVFLISDLLGLWEHMQNKKKSLT